MLEPIHRRKGYAYKSVIKPEYFDETIPKLRFSERKNKKSLK